MMTSNGIIEAIARLLTKIAFILNCLSKLSTNFAEGNFNVSATQFGLFIYAIFGASVN